MNDDLEPRDESLSDEPWREHRDELLERVTKRGRALKVRRQATLVTVVTCVLLVPFAAVAATNTQTNVPVLRWASSGSDEPADTTTTTLLATTTTVPDETTSTTVPDATTTSTAPGATSTTTIPPVTCRASLDPACGPLRWDPEPPAVNPVGVEVGVTKVDGRTVTVQVDTTSGGLITVDFGDGSENPTAGDGGFYICYGSLHGTWGWPESEPEHEEFTHEYAATGSYKVTVTVTPRLMCGETPYTESSASATVVVPDVPSTTTTTRP